MNDDWRLRIDMHDHGLARELGEHLDAEELEHDLERAFQDRVVVSVEDQSVFCYTGSRSQAERAEAYIRQVVEAHGWNVDIQLSHWHPVAERWEDPDTPLPADAATAEHEREERVEQEREDSAEQGYPEMELRVQCASRADAGALSERLDADGIPHLRRHSYLLIGATDEDAAASLAERVRGLCPATCELSVERNRRAIYDNRLWSAFTLLGGLGG